MNTMDKRSFAAIVMFVVFYLAYSHYLNTKYPKPVTTPQVETTAATPEKAPANTAPATTTTAAPAAAVAATTATVIEVTRLTDDQLTIVTDKVKYQFSQQGGALTAVTLNDYKAEIGAESAPVNLLESPMVLQGFATVGVLSSTPQVSTDFFSAERTANSIRFTRNLDSVRIVQEFIPAQSGYGATVKLTYTNTSATDIDLNAGLLLQRSILPHKNQSSLSFIPGTVTMRNQAVYSADDKTEWVDIENYCKDSGEPHSLKNAGVKYFGVDHHYFLTLVESLAKTSSLQLAHGVLDQRGCQVTFVSGDQQGNLPSGQSTTIEYHTYFGPKDLGILKAQDATLESAMHLGAFSFIGRPLLAAIEGFHRVVKNYGLAIVLLTICLKIVFYPLVKASSTSMHKMKKLNPQMQAIKDRFKDDKQRQQQELMKFMVSNKINPMKGCLPILPQIPVFFAFYQVLQSSIQLRHAPFFLWIHDLSSMDPYLVTPILMGCAMFVQQKLTPTTGMDKTQEKVMMFMPIMFTAMMLTLPAGLTLYMLTNTVIGIAQQKWLYYKLDKLDAQTV